MKKNYNSENEKVRNIDKIRNNHQSKEVRNIDKTKNNYRSKKILIILIILLLFILIIFQVLSIMKMEDEYQRKLYEVTNIIINNVSENNKAIDKEVIKDLLSSNHGNSEYKDILSLYGINQENFDDILENNNVGDYKRIESTLLILSITILIILFLILLWYIYKRYEKERIIELDNYCKEILNGNYEIDLKEQKEGDFSILRNDIYHMTVMLKEKNKSLEKNNLNTEKLIADISHQLKTPLTSLNLMNDILYTENSEEKRKEFLDLERKELDKISWLIKTLLNISKLDSKTMILQKKNENAYDLMLEIKESFSAICEANKSKIEIISNKNEVIHCDRKWTKEAIGNIVKNALEHKSTLVLITLSQNKLFTEISIKDNGEGIDKKDLYHIFERFYKAENSKDDSLGLGLAFSKSIIHNQGGSIKVTSSKDKGNSGTEFNIKFYF